MAHLDLRPANIFIKQNPDIGDKHLSGSCGRESSIKSTIADLLVAEDFVLKLGDLGHVCVLATKLDEVPRQEEGAGPVGIIV